MKKICLTATLLTSLVLSACSTAPNYQHLSAPVPPVLLQGMSTEPGFGDPGFVPEPDQALAVRMLRQLYKDNFADDVDNGRPDDPIQEPRGGLVYEGLNRLSWVRKALYLLSDKVIKYEFNKPGVPDQAPAINAAQLHDLESKLQPGDIVLCGNDDSFVHGLIYLGNDQIIHALAQLTPDGQFLGVIQETLSGYTQRVDRDKFVVLRKPGLTAQDVQRISDYAHSMLGTSYDSLFLLSTKDRVYCTEILYHALQQIAQPPRIYPHRAKYGWDLFTVEDLMDSPDLQTVWTLNYQRPAPGQLHRY